jgi:hypothetical protein
MADERKERRAGKGPEPSAKKNWMDKLRERFQNVAATLELLMALPIIGQVLKSAFGYAQEHIDKKAKNIFGTNTDDAGKCANDEGLHNLGIQGLEEAEVAEVNAFEVELRGKFPKDAESWVLFMAQNISAFKREEKRSTVPPKGTSGPRVEQSFTDYAEGIKWAVSFLRALLKQTDPDPKVTFTKRYDFLKGKNAFSLKSPEKKVAPIVEKITDYVMHLPEKAWVYMLNNQEEVLWAINDANCKLKQINGGPYQGFRKTPIGSSGAVIAARAFAGLVVLLLILGIIFS